MLLIEATIQQSTLTLYRSNRKIELPRFTNIWIHLNKKRGIHKSEVMEESETDENRNKDQNERRETMTK